MPAKRKDFIIEPLLSVLFLVRNGRSATLHLATFNDRGIQKAFLRTWVSLSSVLGINRSGSVPLPALQGHLRQVAPD